MWAVEWMQCEMKCSMIVIHALDTVCSIFANICAAFMDSNQWPHHRQSTVEWVVVFIAIFVIILKKNFLVLIVTLRLYRLKKTNTKVEEMHSSS